MEGDQRDRFVYEVKLFLSMSTSLFVLSLIAGMAMAAPTGMVPYVMEPLRRVAELLRGAPPPLQAMLIFLNNALKALLNVLLGPLLGIYPLFFVLLNGFVLGTTISYFIQLGMGHLLLALLPHGAIEIPAMLVSSAMGFRLAAVAIRRLLGAKGLSLRSEVGRSLSVLGRYVIPALALAALVEVYVSGAMLGIHG